MAKTRHNSSHGGGGGGGGGRDKGSRFLPKYFTDKNIALSHAVHHANNRQRKVIIGDANKSLIRCICECALNILSGRIKLDGKRKNKLAKYKHTLCKLVKSTKNKVEKRGKKKIWLKKKNDSYSSTVVVHF